MELSSKSTRALLTAVKLDPDNPRLHFVQGMVAIYTPENFGGGIDKAASLFVESSARFKEQNHQVTTNNEPVWGEDEVHMWLGVVQSVKGNTKEAISALQTSLAVSNNQWIEDTLLPTLKEGKSIGPYFGLN